MHHLCTFQHEAKVPIIILQTTSALLPTASGSGDRLIMPHFWLDTLEQWNALRRNLLCTDPNLDGARWYELTGPS